VHSPFEGSALVSVALTLPEAVEAIEGTCGGSKLLFPNPKAALAGYISQNHTESQNVRNWKGPMWVI